MASAAHPNLPGYLNTYGMHTLHGRSLPVATGAKLGNHKLTVIATGGDGDGYGIGGNHLMHTARRNIDLTYLVMNNQIYGLTTGQVSPTSRPDMKTKSTPFGNLEYPINPITSAIMNGATYVARAYSADPKHLTEIIKKGIEHKGFSLIDVFSPCVTFNHDNRLRVLQATDKEVGRRRARPRRLEGGLREGVGMGRRNLHRVVPRERPALP